MWPSGKTRWIGCYTGVIPAAVLLAGCANPGPPKPPSLHLVKPATSLSAERVGNVVHLEWIVPAESTDGGTLRLPLTAVVCRGELSMKSEQAPCGEVAHVPVKSGPGGVTDSLPSTLDSGEPRLLTYRIELLNADGHSAGASEPVYAAAGSAPTPIASFLVRPVRNGATLSWTPDSSGAVEVTRAPVPGPLPRARSRNHDNFSAGIKPKDELVTLSPGTEIDPGGMIDRGIHDGDEVVYRAVRVHRVRLDVPVAPARAKRGHVQPNEATSQSFELRGESSAPVDFTFHDTIPPPAPQGLAAVPGGGFGQPPFIDLSWELDPDPDLSGYNVYRSETSGAGPEKRLNQDVVAAPSFHDVTVVPGVSYLYRVTAVDRRGHESVAGVPVHVHFSP